MRQIAKVSNQGDDARVCDGGGSGYGVLEGSFPNGGCLSTGYACKACVNHDCMSHCSKVPGHICMLKGLFLGSAGWGAELLEASRQVNNGNDGLDYGSVSVYVHIGNAQC